MSAKNVSKASDPLDRCYTPRWCVDQCAQEILLPFYNLNPASILEPSAGGGVFVDAMRLLYPKSHITAADLDPEAGSFLKGRTDRGWQNADVSLIPTDFLDWPSSRRYDLIVGNPPYTYAREFIEKGLSLTDNLVFILRQGFLSSGERAEFFKAHPPMAVVILPNRPSYSGDGKTDSADYCWVCWGRRWSGTRLFWMKSLPKSLRV